MNCHASEYAKYKTMQSIDCCAKQPKNVNIRHAFTLEYSVAMETLYKIQVTSSCAFVANKMFECILLNATTDIEAFEFYYVNKRKLTKFSEKFHPNIYTNHQ